MSRGYDISDFAGLSQEVWRFRDVDSESRKEEALTRLPASALDRIAAGIKNPHRRAVDTTDRERFYRKSQPRVFLAGVRKSKRSPTLGKFRMVSRRRSRAVRLPRRPFADGGADLRNLSRQRAHRTSAALRATRPTRPKF